mgnify:CR=1 FL=1
MSRKSVATRLRHRLTLQEPVHTPDSGGGYVSSWNDVAQLWAEILPVSGRERLFAGKVQAQVTHRILVRYRSDISTSHRLAFESRVFNIRSVMNERECNETLEILVEEGVA